MLNRRKILGGGAAAAISGKVNALTSPGSVCFLYGSRILPFTLAGIIHQSQQVCSQAFPFIKVTYLDNIDNHPTPRDALEAHFKENGTKLVIITSANTGDVVESIISRHQDKFFIFSGGTDIKQPNIFSYMIKWYEQTYIIGYLMGLITQDDYIALQSKGNRFEHTIYSFMNGAAIGAWAAGKKLNLYRSDRTPVSDLLLTETLKNDKPTSLILLNDNGVSLNRSLGLFPTIRVAAVPAEKTLRRIVPNNLLAFTGINLDSFLMNAIESWRYGQLKSGEVSLGFDQNIHSFDFFPLIAPDVMNKVKQRLRELDVASLPIPTPANMNVGTMTLNKSISDTTLDELKTMKLWDYVDVRFGEI